VEGQELEASMKIINNLDRIMWERKITAVELARKSTVSIAKVNRIRNNPDENITKETMEKLLRALEIGLTELLAVEQESQTPVAA
jgi:DNA-binding Xre family transcriptional regulator